MYDQQNERVHTSPISEYYNDLLRVDAWVAGKTRANQAASLLCAKLHERETKVKERLEYLAKKRGITGEQLWQDILSDRAGENTEKE